MNMKSTIFDLWQAVSRRLLLCTLVFGFCVVPAMAQTEDEEEDEDVEDIKQPVRRSVADKYPTITLKGVVTDQATGQPLVGIQLQALGYIRYTAMTEDDGTFSIKVPEFATSLGRQSQSDDCHQDAQGPLPADVHHGYRLYGKG